MIEAPKTLEEAKAVLEGREIDFGAHSAIRFIMQECERLRRELQSLRIELGDCIIWKEKYKARVAELEKELLVGVEDRETLAKMLTVAIRDAIKRGEGK